MARLALASVPSWKMLLIITFVFCAILTGVAAGPTGGRRTSKCVSFCKDSSKFSYEPGTSYYYDYSSDISTFAIGGSGDGKSRIHLKAKAEISAVTSCELILRLQEVIIEESLRDDAEGRQTIPGSQALITELQRLPLRFSFQDGKVEHLCAAEDEPTWALNLKRGILSALQNTMDDLSHEQDIHEADVNGRCQTTYKPLGDSWSGSKAFQKIKNLAGCSHRHSHVSAIQSIPYTSQSVMQNLPLLASQQECTQNIRNGKVERVQCQEVHKFQPFEQQDSGAQTMVSQLLVFDSERTGFVPSDESLNTWKTTLLYQSEGPVDASEEDVLNLMTVLQKLEDESVPEIRADAPEQFINLVEGLRLISVKAMKDLFTRVTSPTGKKFLLDAMPLVASAPSLALMRDLLLDGRLTVKQVDAWLTSLAFIKHPTVEMLTALKPLVDYQPRGQALLGISAMVNSYCKLNSECTEEGAVEEILEKLFSYLGNGCEALEGPEEISRILFALKAIGNAGRLPADDNQRSMETLQRCFNEKSNPTEVRLAALDAFRRMPCGSYDHEPIINAYATINENTEFRIKAYLIAMKCASRHLVDTVKDILYTDAVNQVSSFVWTHLTNLQETTSPDKQAIRELLSNEFLKNKFNTDARKYSRNYEGSFYSDRWNAGASTDANVIFTPDSFLPRSGMLNLTVHLFGDSINLLEVGVRLKQLEHLLEPIFGPNGYFPDQKVNEALHSMRPKRDVSDNRIERLPQIYSQAEIEKHQPTGSIYTRIFGHEVMYKNFEIGKEGNRPSLVDETGKDWMDIRSLLTTITSGSSIEYKKSSVFLDATYTVPTGAGIPLSLSIQSAATVGVTANGKINTDKFWDQNELEIKGLLRPSAAVQIDGVISAQLGRASNPIRSGLRLQNTLHSSTAIQGEIVAKGAKLIRSSISLPQDRQEIFTAKSQLLILRPSGKHHLIEQGPADLPVTAWNSCKANTFLGLEICTEVRRPNQFSIPLATPTLISLYASKIDSISSYDFNYEFNNGETGTSLTLTFDTPGSRINRRAEANFQLDSISGALDASVSTPGQSLVAQGKYSSREKSLQLTATASEQQILFINAALLSDGNRFTPNLLLKFYNRPLVEFHGVVDMLTIKEENGRANVEFTLKHLTQTPVIVRGDISRNGEKFDSRIGVESYLLTGNLRSQLRLKAGYLSTKAVAEYSWQQAESKSIDITAKLQQSKKGVLSKFNALVSLVLPDEPDYKFDASIETQKSPGYCESNVKLALGKVTWEGKTLYNNQRSRDSREFAVLAALKSPRYDVDYHAEFSHQWNQTAMITKILGHTEADSPFYAGIEYLDKSVELLKKSMVATTSWPGSEYSLSTILNEISPQEYVAELTILHNDGNEMKATANYKDGSNDLKLDHHLTLRARGFLDEHVSGNYAFTASDRQAHFGAQLEVEGNASYSGKWSTSLDYRVVKKSTHKLEGKLTLNDVKYNGELSFRQAKNGDRIFTLDAQGSRHLSVEATMNGDIDGPLSLTLTVYPDKFTDPSGKFALATLIQPGTITVKVDNFGKKILGSLQYDESRIGLECNYVGELYKLQVAFPSLSPYNTNVTVRVDTPMDDYRTMLITLNHLFAGHHMDSKVHASVNDFVVELNFLGSHSHEQTQLVVAMDMTDAPSLKGKVHVINTSIQRSLDVTVSRDDVDSSIKAQFTRVDGGFSALIDFNALSSLSQFRADVLHQITAQLNSNVKVQWTAVGGSQQQVTAQLTGQTYPLDARFIITSPWKKAERFEGGISFQNDRNQRELSFSLDGDFKCMPVSLTIRCKGDRSNFRHEIIQSWKSQGSPKTIQFMSEGHYSSLSDSIVRTRLTLPQDTYELSWTGERSEGEQKYELDVAKNEEHYRSGVTWISDSQQKHAKFSAWCEPQGKQRFLISFENTRRPDHFHLQFETSRGPQVLLKTSTIFRTAGFGQWDFSSDLDSVYDSIPKLKVSSKNSAQDGKLEHKSNLIFGGKASREGRRGIYEIPQAATAEFNLRDGRHFDGQLAFNDDTIKIQGQLKRTDSKQEMQAQITSTRFSSVSARAEVQTDPNEQLLSFSASSDGKTLIVVQAGTQTTGETVVGNLDVDCSFGHHIVAEATVNKNEKQIDFKVKEDRANLLDMYLLAKAKSTEGNLKLELQSNMVAILQDKVVLSGEYTLGKENKILLKYTLGDVENSIQGMAAYNDQRKALSLSLRGSYNGDFKAEISELGKAEASLTWNDRLLFETKAEIAQRVSQEYPMLYHDVKITTTSVYLENPFETTMQVGFGNGNIHINIQTPIQGWTRLNLLGELQRSDSNRKIKIIVEKETSKISVEGTCIKLPKGRQFSLRATTPWRFHTAAVEIEYERKQGYEGTIAASLNDQEVKGKVKFSPKIFSLDTETPFELLQRGSISATWNLSDTKKNLNINVERNSETYELQSSWEGNSVRGDIKTVLQGFGTSHTLSLNYELGENYHAHATLSSGSEADNIACRVVLNKQTIEIDGTTPFSGYERFYAKAGYENKSAQHHFGNMEWRLNGEGGAFSAEIKYSGSKIQLQATSSLPGLENFKLDIVHSFGGPRKELSIQGQLNESKPFKFSLEGKADEKVLQFEHSAASARVSVDVDFPMQIPLQLQMSAEYTRRGNSHSLKGSITHNGEKTEGNFLITLTRNPGFTADIKITAIAPAFNIVDLEATSLIILRRGSSSFSAESTLNGEKHEVRGTFQTSANSIQLEVDTTIGPFRTLRVQAGAPTAGLFQVTASVDDNQGSLQCRYHFDGIRHSKFSIDLTTPFEDLKSIQATAEIQIQPGLISASMNFQNDKYRYVSQLAGTYTSEYQGYLPPTMNIVLTLKSPVYRFESLISTFKYSISSPESQVEFSFDRNTRKEIIASAVLSNGEFNFNVTSTTVQFPVTASGIAQLNPFTLITFVEVGSDSDNNFKLETNIVGVTVGTVAVRTPFANYRSLSAQWNVEGDIGVGKAQGKFNLPRLGEKSLTTNWKTDNWQSAKLEIFYQDRAAGPEKRYAVQYAVSGRRNGNGKIGASVVYNVGGKEQQVTLNTSVKRIDNAFTVDCTLHTPYQIVKEASARAKLTLGQETSIDLSASLNENVQLVSNVIVSVSPKTSKFKLTFSAPALGEPFSLNAAYDVTRPEKSMEISFVQNKYQISIRTDAKVPQNSNEIELHISVDSNVPLLQISASGRMKAGYLIDADGTRRLSVSVNSDTTGKWDVTGALRPTSDFYALLQIQSPRPEIILSSKTELVYTGNMRQGISSYASFQIGEYREVKLSFSISMEKIVAAFVSGLPGYEDISFEAKFESAKGFFHKQFQVQANAMGENLNIHGYIHIPSRSSVRAHGELNMTSSWEKIPDATLKMQVDEDGSGIVEGTWGARSLTIRGSLKGAGRQPWKRQGTSSIILEVNTEKYLEVEAVHFVGDNMYSLNVTVGEDYQLDTFLQTDVEKVVAGRVQWRPDQVIQLFGKAGLGRFEASLTTPWVSPIEANGMYTVTEREHQAKGYFVYGGERSALEATAITAPDTFDSSISIDIPALHQKFDTRVKIQKTNDDKVNGNIDIQMADRRLSIEGELGGRTFSKSGRQFLERNIKILMTLPSTTYPRISTEVTLELPKQGFSSFKIDASLSLPSGTSKGTFGYEVPIHPGQGLGFQVTLDSPYVSAHPMEFSVVKEAAGASMFDLRFQYEQNDLHVSYDTSLSKLHVAVFANVPELFENHNPIRVELTGVGKWPTEQSIKLSGSCSQYTFSVEGQVDSQNDGDVNARFVLNVPALLQDQYELTAKVQRNTTGHYFLDLTGVRGTKSLELKGEVTTLIENMGASVRITGALGSHFAQSRMYQEGQDWTVEVNGESATLLRGRRFKAEGKFKPAPQGFDAEITCRTRSSTHSAKISSVLTLSNGKVRLILDSPTLPPFTANTEWSIERELIQGKLDVNAGDEQHQVEALLNFNDLEALVRLHCPLLLSEEFSVHGKAVVNSNTVEFLGNAKMNGAQWKLQGVTQYENSRNMEVRLELRTPFEDWERITFAGKSSPTEILADIHTPFPNFPSAMFRLAGLPILSFYEKPDIRLLDGARPVLTVGLPWVNYTISGALKVPEKGAPGEFGVTVEYGHPKQTSRKRYEASVQFPSIEDFSWHMENSVKLRMNIRMPKSANIQWELGGRLQWKTWAELNAMAELNGQRVECTSEIRNEQGNRRLSITVTTPFEGYERYVASLRLENYREIGRGRTILVELEKPEWENPVRLEIDYRYRFNGFADMDAEITAVAPRFVIDFPPMSLRVQSTMRGGRYVGLLEGNWRQTRPSLKIEAGVSSNSAFGSVEGVVPNNLLQGGNFKGSFNYAKQNDDVSLTTEIKYADEQIMVLEASMNQSDTDMNAKMSLVSPFQLIRTAALELRLSPLGKRDSITIQKLLNSLDVGFGVNYNSQKVFQISLVSKDGRRSMEVYNPVRPVSVTMTFERVPGQKLRVLSEICWNLKTPSKSTLAVEFGVIKTSSLHSFSVRVQAGELGGVESSLLHHLTSTRFEQALSIRIINPLQPDLSQEVGYSFYLIDSSSASSANYDLSARVDTPWRSIGLEASQHKAEKQTERKVELKWDALRDISKRIGFKTLNERTSTWKIRTVKDRITVIHSTLPDDFVLAVERTYKIQQLHSLELVLQPSRYPQDYITFAMSRENMGPNGAQVILSHPASNLNTKIVGTRTATAAAVAVTYMDVTGESQEAQISFTSDASSTSFEINAGKDLPSIWKFEIGRYPDRRTYNLRSGNIKLDMNVVKTLPYMEMNLQYDESRELHLIAGLPHTKEVSFKIWRKDYGMNIQDVQATLRLNGSQILSSKFNWRPEFFDEVYHLVTESGPKHLIKSGSKGFSLIRSSVIEELQGRWNMVEPNTREFLENFAAYTYNECSTIYGEFNATIQYFADLYDRNRFYMKDVGNFVGVHVGSLLDACSSSFESVFATAKSVGEAAFDISRKVVQWCSQYCGTLEKTIMKIWDGADEYLLQQWEEAMSGLAEMMEKLEEMYDAYMVLMEQKYEELEERILAIGWVRKLIRLYEDYASWIEELPGPIQEVLEAMKEFINVRICQPMEEVLKPYYDKAKVMMEHRNIQTILETPPFPYLRHVAGRIQALGARLWNLIEAEKRLKELTAEALHALDSLVASNMPTTSLTWEVEKGHVEFHHPLVLLQWDDFTTWPHWKSDEDDAHQISKINQFYYEVLDTIRHVKPALEMNLRDILPPFGAHAVMAGDYHYYTFDKKYFRFAGECSYVLVADLLHQNFSLLVNYESMNGDVRKKSYTLVTQRHSVDIEVASLKVTLDGRKVELPLEVGPTFIRRMPNGIEIFDSRGFQMTCNQSPALCTISVSGWYFGKMAGLLGTYDNEESNDMRTPDGEIVTEVANFAHSWRVGESSGGCRMKNMARGNGELADVDGICSQQFDDATSLLRPCFSRVNTTIFKNMCMFDTSKDLNRASREGSACTAISAYVAECQKEGVDIWLPPPCIRCRLEDGTTLTSGESAIIRADGTIKPPNSTDVVILLEEAPCLTGSPFAEAIKRLDSALRAKGMNDNRYALVGYGGRGPHRSPHIHTTAGQIWTHNTLFRMNDNIEMNGDGQGDLYDAIEFSSRTLKFRAGVTKTMIAMTCGSEHCGSASRYPDTITLLVENDIRLHLLTPKEFVGKGNKRESANISNKIFGMDSEGVYTLSHARDASLEPDSSMKRLLSLPKDLCTPLAIESNGTRFVFPKTPKKSLDVWARRVTKTAEPPSCQQCECIPDKSGSPHVVCQQCISPGLQQELLDWQQYSTADEALLMELADLEQS